MIATDLAASIMQASFGGRKIHGIKNHSARKKKKKKKKTVKTVPVLGVSASIST